MSVTSHTPPPTKSKTKSKAKSSTTGTGTKTKSRGESPWEIGPDGKRRRASRALPLETRMREFLLGTAAMASLADEFVGRAIELKADELAYGWAKLAAENPQVKRVLTMIFEGSAWAEALVPSLSLVVMVGWHYEMIPSRIGIPVVMANGMPPVTREYERDARKVAAETAEMNENGSGGNSES